MILNCALFVLFVFFFLIPALSRYAWSKSKYLKNLPGPKPNAYLGNLIEFLGPKEGFLPKLHEFSQTYGPIFKFHYGPFIRVVMVAEEKFLKYILNSTKLVNKSIEYNIFHNWLGTGLLTSAGIKWKKRRRMLIPAFHNSVLENFIDVFDRLGNIFMDKLDKEVGKPTFDIYPMTSLLTLDIICETAMGVHLEVQKNGNLKFLNSIKVICEVLTKRLHSPLHPSLYPFTLDYWRERKAIAILHAFTGDIIGRRMETVTLDDVDEEIETGVEKRKLAFLDLLLRSTIDGITLTIADIREEVDTFIMEGYHTTSSAVTFTLYCLAANPEKQQKALDEQKEIFGELSKVKPTITDLEQMKYLDMVIKESLRIYAPLAYIAREVPEDFEYEGSLYPKGLTLMLLPYAIHRNPEYFPEPLKFIPERFENGDGKSFSHIPFSAGPRNCIGKKFAMLEMKSIVSKILRTYELLPSSPAHPLVLLPDLVLVSKGGIRISIERRETTKGVTTNGMNVVNGVRGV
ncbi:hypothetical protein JTB14_002040 [Gonioctena quinquepunctata]|nr:hypothetical protein JTB14_002040 [Gonioctena quinquepunctata]